MARFFALGYLWGDGHPHEGGWGFRSCELASADRFAASAEALGAVVKRSQARPVCGRDNSPMYAVRADSLSLDVNLPGMPPALRDADDAETREFLVGVIEGEGNGGSGLVLDDPMASRVTAMATLLARVSVRTDQQSNQNRNFFRLFAVKADWAKFGDWPWASCARVPGHNC